MAHILIVDDESSIRESLRGILEDEGYKTSVSPSGEDCLELLRKSSFDLILLDVWLTGIDGLEVLEKIREMDDPPEVIMISGHGTIETAVRATKLGAMLDAITQRCLEKDPSHRYGDARELADGIAAIDGAVVLNDVDEQLAAYHAVRLLTDEHTSPLSGEPAITAAQTLAMQGQYLPLYGYAVRTDATSPEIVAECLRSLKGVPLSVLRPLVDRYIASPHEIIVLGLFELLLEHPEKRGFTVRIPYRCLLPKGLDSLRNARIQQVAKTVDTLIWINRTSPDAGFPAAQYYAWKPFGTWILFAEIVVFGLIPALIMLTPRLRRRTGWLVSAAAMACLGVALNRFVLTVQTLALPTLAFDKFLSYWPSWQETGTFLAVVAYGVLV